MKATLALFLALLPLACHPKPPPFVLPSAYTVHNLGGSQYILVVPQVHDLSDFLEALGCGVTGPCEIGGAGMVYIVAFNGARVVAQFHTNITLQQFLRVAGCETKFVCLVEATGRITVISRKQ